MTSRRSVSFLKHSCDLPRFCIRLCSNWNSFPLQVYASQRMRAGKGKMRNRRRIQRRGPCIIYNQDAGVTKAFRNIPGVFDYTCLSFLSAMIHYVTVPLYILLMWLSPVTVSSLITFFFLNRNYSSERKQTEPPETCSWRTRWTFLHLDRECFP